MSRVPGLFRTLTLALLVADARAAGGSGWDNRLVEKVSQRWQEIQTELAAITLQLENLPEIPIDNQGGTGGFASYYPLTIAPKNADRAIEVRWKSSAMVDLVALVPARRYDAKGLHAQYGLPAAFSVELIDAQGRTVRLVAQENKTRTNPIRGGHPFVYQVSPPVAALGLRISAQLLNPKYESEGSQVQAWAEAMVFEGQRDVALGAETRNLAGAAPPAPWHWSNAFLVDGETPLGLPEEPGAPHVNIGWMSEARTRADQATSLNVDLGESTSFDAVRLVPAKRPTSDLPSGFGFPKKITISVSETGNIDNWRTVAEREFANPGHNPVVISLEPTQARFIKVVATQLWKAFDDYPAFFALSEIEVVAAGKNLAAGKNINSPDGMMIASGGGFWSSAALNDGFGPDGRLVSTREWMLQLDRRLQLETRRHALQAEATQLVDGWRHAAQIGFVVVALVGAFFTIALPIRYRLHARRELSKVRERIAGDLHDEVGSNLGSIQMFADLAEGRSGTSDELKRIQRIAAETVSAVRDIVWLLRPTGDHRIGTVEHLRETTSIMLESLTWKFTANEPAWQVELSEESTRDLFLFFREALHNIMRHAKARGVEIHAEKSEKCLCLTISDDGVGIDPLRLERASTLRALKQRSKALGGNLLVKTSPEHGTRLILTVPLAPVKKGLRRRKSALSQPSSLE